MYIALFTLKIKIYQAKKSQINVLIIKKITILEEFLDFANIFLKKLVKVLPKYIKFY